LTVFLAAHGGEDVVIAAITAAELLHGVHRMTGARRHAPSASSRRSARRWRSCRSISTSPARTQRWGADFRARGIGVGAHDLMIAATAVSRDHAVATRDLRSFPRIEGIEVVRW
jgi:predicted nucleic acid-binding protein